MIRALRRKFVIVTMSFMAIIFGIIFTANFISNKYWDKQETALLLEWIAKTGIFTSEEFDVEKEKLVLDLSENEKPIIGILVNINGEIISKRIIGGTTYIKNLNDIVKKITIKGQDSHTLRNFVYSYNKLNNNEILLVIMDTSVHGIGIKRMIANLFLLTIGFSLLLLITFYLSKFVTAPAKTAILREKQFVSDASHELKTPLGAITINAQALESHGLESVYIKNIISESARMSRLIERLLTLSRLDEAALLEKEIFSLSDVCEEMSLTYESIAYEKKINYEYSIEADIKIKANEDEIRQLFAILIDNAIKNTNENGKISILCKNIKGKSQLIIRNTGPGIVPEDLPHLFERFYTTHKARENESFGLGLAIAKSIVERHKGTITVDSEVNKYSTFTVIF